MAPEQTTDPKPDYTNDDTGEPKPPPPLAWEPPGGLNHRSVRRGANRRPRRPR